MRLSDAVFCPTCGSLAREPATQHPTESIFYLHCPAGHQWSYTTAELREMAR